MRSVPLLQNEGESEAFDIVFFFLQAKGGFYKKGFTLGFAVKVRVF